jgi:hypothetical protein
MADVEILTEQVTQLCQLDYRYGSGRLREQVVLLLHHEANQLLHGTYLRRPDLFAKTGKALLTAVAQATKPDDPQRATWWHERLGRVLRAREWR